MNILKKLSLYFVLMVVGFERLLSVNELNKLHLVFVSQCSSDMEKEFAGNSPSYT